MAHGVRHSNQQPNPKRYQEWRDGLQCGHKVQRRSGVEHVQEWAEGSRVPRWVDDSFAK